MIIINSQINYDIKKTIVCKHKKLFQLIRIKNKIFKNLKILTYLKKNQTMKDCYHCYNVRF